MYNNLRIECLKKDIKRKDLAFALNLHENSISNKFLGKSPFTIEEAFEIKKQFFPCEDLAYLFLK